MSRPLPFAPLERYVKRWGHSVLAAFGPPSSSSYRAYHLGRKRGGFTVDMADRLAGELGCHPVEIWGSDWEA